jgi:hypothetical protein
MPWGREWILHRERFFVPRGVCKHNVANLKGIIPYFSHKIAEFFDLSVKVQAKVASIHLAD